METGASVRATWWCAPATPDVSCTPYILFQKLVFPRGSKYPIIN